MKNYAKVGKRLGKPAYRTPSSFRYKQNVKIRGIKRGKNKSRSVDIFGRGKLQWE